jgi:uncharacterized membrane protein
MSDILDQVINVAVLFVEACGAVVILLEVIRTIIRYVFSFTRREQVDMPALRMRLGQSMVMGLEFQVAADILRTAVSPTWSDILFLATLIALRTVLNYLLERELTVLDEWTEEGVEDDEDQ